MHESVEHSEKTADRETTDRDRRRSEGHLLCVTVVSEPTSICQEFHAPHSACRTRRIVEAAKYEQKEVDKKFTSLKANLKNIHLELRAYKNQERPEDLKVPLSDISPEKMLTAARYANQPFKKTLKQLLQNLDLPSSRLIIGPVKRLESIKRKRNGQGHDRIFDLNRATLLFGNSEELKLIMEHLRERFIVVYLKNKFLEEEVFLEKDSRVQPPCLHMNLYLKRTDDVKYPTELEELLCPSGADWIVELQVSTKVIYDLNQCSHAFYEICRLQSPEIEIPRACPVCHLFQTFVRNEEIQILACVSHGMKIVQKAKWRRELVAYNYCIPESQEEIKTITPLDHPNIVKVVGVVEGKQAFLTEWMPGGTLSSLLRNDLLSPEQIWLVALQVCDALKYLHTHGVVHYDVKSPNIVCTDFPDLRVKLCDFGLSFSLQSTRTHFNSVGGTINCRAPETFERIERHHPAADVYSFGCLLIELFTPEHNIPWSLELENQNDREAEVPDDEVIKRKVKKHELPPEIWRIPQPLIQALVRDCLSKYRMRPDMSTVEKRLREAQTSELQPGDRNPRRLRELKTKLAASCARLKSHVPSCHESTSCRDQPVEPSILYWRAPRSPSTRWQKIFFGLLIAPDFILTKLSKHERNGQQWEIRFGWLAKALTIFLFLPVFPFTLLATVWPGGNPNCFCFGAEDLDKRNGWEYWPPIMYLVCASVLSAGRRERSTSWKQSEFQVNLCSRSSARMEGWPLSALLRKLTHRKLRTWIRVVRFATVLLAAGYLAWLRPACTFKTFCPGCTALRDVNGLVLGTIAYAMLFLMIWESFIRMVQIVSVLRDVSALLDSQSPKQAYSWFWDSSDAEWKEQHDFFLPVDISSSFDQFLKLQQGVLEWVSKYTRRLTFQMLCLLICGGLSWFVIVNSRPQMSKVTILVVCELLLFIALIPAVFINADVDRFWRLVGEKQANFRNIAADATNVCVTDCNLNLQISILTNLSKRCVSQPLCEFAEAAVDLLRYPTSFPLNQAPVSTDVIFMAQQWCRTTIVETLTSLFPQSQQTTSRELRPCVDFFWVKITPWVAALLEIVAGGTVALFLIPDQGRTWD